MLSFTILRPSKCGCGRYYIYNQYGGEIAQCASMTAVFAYFYTWVEKLNSESVTFSRTKDKDVILAKIV